MENAMPEIDRNDDEYSIGELVDDLLKYDRISIDTPYTDLEEIDRGEQRLYAKVPANLEGLLSKVRTHEEFCLFLYALEKAFRETPDCWHNQTIDRFLLCLLKLFEDEQTLTHYGAAAYLSWQAFGGLLLQAKDCALQSEEWWTHPEASVTLPQQRTWDLVNDADTPKKVALVLRAMVWDYYQRREYWESHLNDTSMAFLSGMRGLFLDWADEYAIEPLSWNVIARLLLNASNYE
jgi:hypothetical protein